MTDTARLPESFAPVKDLLGPLVGRFGAAGHRVYLVGGLVRDLLLGVPVDTTDIDLTTDATPDQIVAVLRPWADALWMQGARFGTIGAKRGERVFEVTTHRSEIYVSDSRKPQVTFTDRIDADLARRDFTVNAVAVDLVEDRLVDPFDGRADLAACRLRTPLAASISFSEDPLRMLRAARFHAAYGFQPVPELVAAIVTLRDRMRIVAVERVRDELDKLLALTDPTPGLRLLLETGLADVFLAVSPDGPGDLTLDTAHLVARAQPVDARRWAVLGHLVAGSDAAALARHLRAPTATAREVERLARAIDELGDPDTAWSDEAVRRAVSRLTPGLGPSLAAALDVARARWSDTPTRMVAIRRFEAAVADLSAREDLADLDPPIGGAAVRRLLDLPEGREVGAALAVLAEHRLRVGPLDATEAEEVLRRWAAMRSSP